MNNRLLASAMVLNGTIVVMQKLASTAMDAANPTQSIQRIYLAAARAESAVASGCGPAMWYEIAIAPMIAIAPYRNRPRRSHCRYSMRSSGDSALN
ncbi:MAG: hypothetical protein JOY90_31690 [Bradyrhizobium sp.]|nr:hypothetical protein [Bradyrhizobium sp.]